MSNVFYLGLGIYKVNNQSGLKGLIKSKSDNGEEYYESYKDAIQRGLSSYPNKYPAIVSIVDAYYGFHYPRITAYEHSEIIDVIPKLQEVLDGTTN